MKCQENEGVDYIFGVPGEENMDLLDALLGSSIRFVMTRHEQGMSRARRSWRMCTAG